MLKRVAYDIGKIHIAIRDADTPTKGRSSGACALHNHTAAHLVEDVPPESPGQNWTAVYARKVKAQGAPSGVATCKVAELIGTYNNCVDTPESHCNDTGTAAKSTSVNCEPETGLSNDRQRELDP